MPNSIYSVYLSRGCKDGLQPAGHDALVVRSPSFAPAWALAGTWWDRCRCSSSCSQRLALSAPHSRSSHSVCPKKTGSWRTYHLGGGERKGWRNKNTMMGPLIRWYICRVKEKTAVGQVIIKSSWLPYSCFLLGAFKQKTHTTENETNDKTVWYYLQVSSVSFVSSLSESLTRYWMATGCKSTILAEIVSQLNVIT